MKYKNEFITALPFNDVVSGSKYTYDCWGFDGRNLDKITSLGSFILVKSFPTPVKNRNGVITSTIRNYISVEFYQSIEKYKSIIHPENFESFYIIPIDPDKTEIKNKIIIDIKEKHNL